MDDIEGEMARQRREAYKEVQSQMEEIRKAVEAQSRMVREISTRKMEMPPEMERHFRDYDTSFQEYEPVGHQAPIVLQRREPEPEVYGPPVPVPPLTFRVWLRRLLRLK